MRYYSIEISDGKTGKPFRTYTNFVNGKVDLGGLDVEFDIPLAPAAIPAGQAYVCVWGIPLQEISQAPDLNNKAIKVYGGMKKGLPLANPAQAGLLVSGTIKQAFGNWIGTQQTLNMYIGSPQGSPSDPVNIVLDWKKGQPLADALQTTLARAFPGTTFNAALGDGLVLPHDEQGFYPSLEAFGTYIKQLSKKLVGGDYQGVDIVQREKAFNAYDGSKVTSPKKIAFQDLIGQPTYLGPATISITTVLRADIQVGTFVQLPPGPVTNSAASLSQYRDRSAFQGVFQVDQPRHVGRLRQPDAASWCTVLVAHGPFPASAVASAEPAQPATPGSPNAAVPLAPQIGAHGVIAGPV